MRYVIGAIVFLIAAVFFAYMGYLLVVGLLFGVWQMVAGPLMVIAIALAVLCYDPA